MSTWSMLLAVTVSVTPMRSPPSAESPAQPDIVAVAVQRVPGQGSHPELTSPLATPLLDDWLTAADGEGGGSARRRVDGAIVVVGPFRHRFDELGGVRRRVAHERVAQTRCSGRVGPCHIAVAAPSRHGAVDLGARRQRVEEQLL